MLEAGEMVKHTDLSDFDNGQILMTRLGVFKPVLEALMSCTFCMSPSSNTSVETSVNFGRHFFSHILVI